MVIKLNENKRTIYSTVGYQLFLMHQVKRPLMEGLQELVRFRLDGLRKIRKAYRNFRKMPEPTFENTWHPNTVNILILRSWYCAKVPHFMREPLRTCFSFWAVIYDMDPPWRMVMDRTMNEAVKLDWRVRNYFRNILHLRRWLLSQCHLGEPRDGFTRVLFGLALLAPSPVLIIWRKMRGLKWEALGYGGEPIDFPWWGDEAGGMSTDTCLYLMLLSICLAGLGAIIWALFIFGAPSP